MKKYNLINNTLGWLCFAIAAVTYCLTLEPTASFWDCPEFISQGFKLEVGHPPGNPVFMLAARFFVNFAGGSVEHVALMVNAMSAFFSALTILLLFWTITHLARKLVVRGDSAEISLPQMLVIFGSGLCGALAYTWSDTFWFSAVEGEVYAFSSFCTALVFWLILKWENRADEPHSDRYLVLIAYVIGIRMAVHLHHLRCSSAIVLVIYYKKFANPTATGSLVSLLVSFVIVALILFGLVPGFIEVSQWFELMFVNSFGLSYNTGVLFYAILLVGCFIWAIWECRRQKSPMLIKISFVVCFILSGIPFMGSSWVMPVVIIGAVVAALAFVPSIPVRVLSVALTSIFVIFIGYSSYALLLIRSSANPPMNQNEPDNVFALASYLNREQYGDTPLLYGRTPYSTNVYQETSLGQDVMSTEGAPLYSKVAKTSPDQPDEYIMTGHKEDYVTTPELNMLFPRIYSPDYVDGYKGWAGVSREEPLGETVYGTLLVDENGNSLRKEPMVKPTFAQNMRYFFSYQLNHMYWRYFMWNFAGRQNDIQGNGEPNHGNWITGIPFIDNARLGDQSLLPASEGSANKGRNVFFMLPLLLGVVGLLWQSLLSSRKGIEQFWVVFFLFFMTGIAIVLYLNQTPGQPRERDYAYAGSFYAFAIWIGLGVAAIARGISALMAGKADKKTPAKKSADTDESDASYVYTLPAAIVACIVGLLVPLQMVSQTWDDHDRSGRYTARDFGFNYLNSLDDNAIIFTNGDNDTFPLWYAQEVEGVRTDVKVVNLSYLTTDWYANQVKHPSYNAQALRTIATPTDYAYNDLQISIVAPDSVPVEASQALREFYANRGDRYYNTRVFRHPLMYLPTNLDAAVKSGRITPAEKSVAEDSIWIDFASEPSTARGITLSNLLTLDILTSSVSNGWDRPVYFASTVPESYYIGLTPYMRSTGMAYEVGPVLAPQYSYESTGRFSTGVNTDKMYDNVTKRFRWGGLDKVKSPDDIYLDETVRRMVASTRSQLIDLAQALYVEGLAAADSSATARAADRYSKSAAILDLMTTKLPVEAAPYSVQQGSDVGLLYIELADRLSRPELKEKGLAMLLGEIQEAARTAKYVQSLTPAQYNNLQTTDQYIYHYYLVDLVSAYMQGGGSDEDLGKIKELKDIHWEKLQGAQDVY